jgi:hypothetical protein
MAKNSFQKFGQSLNQPKNLKRIVLIVSLGLILMLVFFVGPQQGWWAIGPDEEETPASPTTMTFLVVDYKLMTAYADDDHEIYIYRSNIVGKTAAEIEDLEYADFSLADSGNDGSLTITPDYDTYVYKGKVNGSDLVEYWFVPILGLNTLRVMNYTEDISMAAYAYPQMDVTLNQTDYRDIRVSIACLDAAEGSTAELTQNEGYLPYYDFENGVYMRFVIRVEFNTTAQLSWCEFRENYDCVEKASGNYLYYEISAVIYGAMDFDLRLGSTIGSSFELIGIAEGIGNAESFTSLDSQN